MGVQASLINGNLTFDADRVQASVLVAPSSLGLAYTSTTGHIQVGTLSVAGDQSFKIAVESEEVTTGAIETAKDDLIKTLNGEMSYMITDMNPIAGKWAMGTTMEVQWDTSGTTFATTVNATTSTNQIVQLATTTGLSVGDVLRFELSSGTSLYYYPGQVAAIGAGQVTLKYKLREIPAQSTNVVRVRGYDLYHGGNVLQNVQILTQLDFPKGGQHILEVYNGSFNSGFSRQLGSAVKTPLTGKMYGTLQDVGSVLNQVVPATTHARFA